MAEVEYPSNSKKKVVETGRPQLQKIVSGHVEVQQQTVGQKVKSVLWGPQAKAALVFIGGSVIAPAIKDMLEDAATSFIRGAFNGGDYARPGARRGAGGSYTNYSSFSKQKKEESRPRDLTPRERANHDFSNLRFESRAEGDMILETLADLINQYDHATVKDMYDLAGITASFTDEKWGWFDLTGASVRRYSDHYVLMMPRTQAID